MQLHQAFKRTNDQIVVNLQDAVYYMGCVEGVMYRLKDEQRIAYQTNGQMITAHYVVPLETKPTNFLDCVCDMYDKKRQKIEVSAQIILMRDISVMDDD